MQLSQLLQIARAQISTAKVSVVDDPTLTLVLNNATVQIATISKCTKGNKKFDMKANQFEYILANVIGDFLLPDKPGLWWLNSSNYMQVYPKTLEWFDQYQADWRSRSATQPQFYSIDGDILTVVGTPQLTVADGFWLYYIKKPVFMAATTDYPFTGTVETTRFDVFDDAIFAYAKWKVDPMLDKQGVDMSEAAFNREVTKAKKLFEQRPDISTDAKMQGQILYD